MIKYAENTIKVERHYNQGEKKNPPTTLNCFLILEWPKEKNNCTVNILNYLSTNK